MEHTHKPQTLANGMTLYICACGARQQKSKIVNGVKVEVWKMESKAEEAAREHAIEMVQTEGHGYDWNKQDVNDPLDSHDPRNQD
jgi:GTP:adenosylcobinamide-phosphate guanylyltransferase